MAIFPTETVEKIALVAADRVLVADSADGNKGKDTSFTSVASLIASLNPVDLTGKQDTLTAGSNITIDANNVISASGGGDATNAVLITNVNQSVDGIKDFTNLRQGGSPVVTLGNDQTLSGNKTFIGDTTLAETVVNGRLTVNGQLEVAPELVTETNSGTGEWYSNSALSSKVFTASGDRETIYLDAPGIVYPLSLTGGSNFTVNGILLTGNGQTFEAVTDGFIQPEDGGFDMTTSTSGYTTMTIAYSNTVEADAYITWLNANAGGEMTVAVTYTAVAELAFDEPVQFTTVGIGTEPRDNTGLIIEGDYDFPLIIATPSSSTAAPSIVFTERVGSGSTGDIFQIQGRANNSDGLQTIYTEVVGTVLDTDPDNERSAIDIEISRGAARTRAARFGEEIELIADTFDFNVASDTLVNGVGNDFTQAITLPGAISTGGTSIVVGSTTHPLFTELNVDDIFYFPAVPNFGIGTVTSKITTLGGIIFFRRSNLGVEVPVGAAVAKATSTTTSTLPALSVFDANRYGLSMTGDVNVVGSLTINGTAIGADNEAQFADQDALQTFITDKAAFSTNIGAITSNDLAGYLQANNSPNITGTWTFPDIVNVGKDIRHAGETDTYIRFNDVGERVSHVVGGNEIFRIEDDRFLFNPLNADLDFLLELPTGTPKSGTNFVMVSADNNGRRLIQHSPIPSDIGAATAAQGALANTALQNLDGVQQFAKDTTTVIGKEKLPQDTVYDADIANFLTSSDISSFITASSTDILTNKSIDAGQLTGTIVEGRIPTTIARTSQLPSTPSSVGLGSISEDSDSVNIAKDLEVSGDLLLENGWDLNGTPLGLQIAKGATGKFYINNSTRHISFLDIGLANGSGINFSSGTTYSDANKLDDYEEEDWTPNPTLGTVDSVSSATYTKTGNVVNLFGRLNITTSAVGVVNIIVIEGIPYAADIISSGTLVISTDVDGVHLAEVSTNAVTLITASALSNQSCHFQAAYTTTA